VLWPVVKTAIFTALVPGTVALYVPQRLKGAGVELPLVWIGAGLVLFACGAAFYLWCAWDFATKGFGTPAPIDPPRQLVVRGLYRFTRNPMYVGVLSMILGQALYYGSSSVAWYGCAALLFFHLFVLLYEEPTLRRMFGSQYEDYCRRVPRWILPLPRSMAK
jgi:protein-S-isoprenylcysteine O-methyltransferase Ste14